MWMNTGTWDGIFVGSRRQTMLSLFTVNPDLPAGVSPKVRFLHGWALAEVVELLPQSHQCWLWEGALEKGFCCFSC